jgi:hypothetical protein
MGIGLAADRHGGQELRATAAAAHSAAARQAGTTAEPQWGPRAIASQKSSARHTVPFLAHRLMRLPCDESVRVFQTYSQV